jgi:ribosomal protein S18 acetylase RimI-like enzyme
MAPEVSVRMLRDGDQALLAGAAAEVFAGAVDPALADAFLKDPRHHIAAALDGGRLVGRVSGIDYWHPDQAPELFISGVAVTPGYRRRGIATRLLQEMLDHGRALGCGAAWVMTEHDNEAAHALYRGAGESEMNPGLVLYAYDLGAPAR